MNEVQKRRRRGRRIHLPVAACLIAFIAVFGTAVFFRVTHIEVLGNERYTPDEILLRANVRTGDNLLLFDRRAAEKRIDGALPYIGTVKISRRLPGTLVIEVTEREVYAALVYDGAYWLIDREARLLETSSIQPENAAILTGVTPRQPEVGRQMAIDGDATGTRRDALINVLSELGDRGLLARVSGIDMSNISSITFIYDSRMTVILGAATEVDRKLEKFVNNLVNIDAGFEGRVDLTGEGVRTYTQ